ncbi:MAG: DUF2065 domain-containing protein [Paracoccaceae bacterium]|nr:DUF2065 family protein [Rhodobacterales bacterium LSUCC0374]MBF9041190.1 DUF2065 family protein [Rhodobacterales bacterium LSUCC0387]
MLGLSWDIIIAGLGMALLIEGLVFVLAPSRLENLIAFLAAIPVEARRLFGFVAVCFGVIILAFAESL